MLMLKKRTDKPSDMDAPKFPPDWVIFAIALLAILGLLCIITGIGYGVYLIAT